MRASFHVKDATYENAQMFKTLTTDAKTGYRRRQTLT